MKTQYLPSFLVRIILISVIILNIQHPVQAQHLQTDKSNIENNKNEWWYPIVKKHGIKVPSFYTCKNVFETGKTVTKSDSTIEFQDAVLIINSGKEYYIFTSNHATHHVRSNTIVMKNGSSEMFNKDSVAPKPVEIVKFNYYKTDLVNNLSQLAGADIWRNSTYTFRKYKVKGRKI